MGKVIQSPSKRYPGSITLSYPLTFPQYATWRRTLDEMPDPPETEGEEAAGWRIFDLAADPDKAVLMLPVIFEIVEKWELQNMPEPLTVETFPSTPPASVYRLLLRILAEINGIISEDDDAEIPFEQPAPLTNTPTAEAAALST